ncbi:MAG: hypothetical protein KatS3mg033_0264 [Thermonema sp.]|jgi:hypothetical protein|nr:MAG: hypothetical protein KatS3mg033_0264 [Thermonema sp.]
MNSGKRVIKKPEGSTVASSGKCYPAKRLASYSILQLLQLLASQ